MCIQKLTCICLHIPQKIIRDQLSPPLSSPKKNQVNKTKTIKKNHAIVGHVEYVYDVNYFSHLNEVQKVYCTYVCLSTEN